MPPVSNTGLLAAANSFRVTDKPATKLVSPPSNTFIFEIIRRTITSICLSETSTPCDLYTFWTSLTIYCCAVIGSVTASNSFGAIEPVVNGSPALTVWPNSTHNLVL